MNGWLLLLSGKLVMLVNARNSHPRKLCSKNLILRWNRDPAPNTFKFSIFWRFSKIDFTTVLNRFQ